MNKQTIKVNKQTITVNKHRLLEALTDLNHVSTTHRALLPWYLAVPYEENPEARIVFLSNDLEKSLVMQNCEQLFYLDCFLFGSITTDYSWDNEFEYNYEEAWNFLEKNLKETITIRGYEHKVIYKNTNKVAKYV